MFMPKAAGAPMLRPRQEDKTNTAMVSTYGSMSSKDEGRCVPVACILN